jgi:hypothetical protein
VSRSRTLIIQDERLLSAADCAQRAGVAEKAWWGIARRSAVLLAGRRVVGSRTRWLQSAFVEWAHDLPNAKSEVA